MNFGRSTIRGRGGGDTLYSACTVGGVDLQQPAAPSDLEELNTRFARVDTSMASNDPASPAVPSNAGARRMLGSQQKQPESNDTRNSPRSEEDFEADESDDEIAMNLVTQHLHLTKKAVTAKDDEAAAKQLRKALARPDLLPKPIPPRQEAEINLLLISSLLTSKNYAEARQICREFLRLKIDNDDDQARVLDASYIVAYISRVFRRSA